MWYALNAGGTTVFLEEDPSWYKTVLKGSPFLTAYHVDYRTHLSEADELLKGWKQEKMCAPENAYLKGNQRCRLALDNLPDVVYEKEWDVIMIDAPKGYFLFFVSSSPEITHLFSFASLNLSFLQLHIFLSKKKKVQGSKFKPLWQPFSMIFFL